MELTSAFQLTPEQSTAAILVHHPQAEILRRARRAAGGERAGARAALAPVRRPPIACRPRLLEKLLDPGRASSSSTARWGTMLLGSKGVFINQCYDELNLRAPPNLVREVHRRVREGRAPTSSRPTALARTGSSSRSMELGAVRSER